jgi:hypothetical protein
MRIGAPPAALEAAPEQAGNNHADVDHDLPFVLVGPIPAKR